MKKVFFDRRKVLAGVLLLVTVFALANDQFALGLLGRYARGFLILCIGLAVIYGMFLAPKKITR